MEFGTTEGLSLLSEIERRYDGPYPFEVTLRRWEITERQAAEARAASSFHAARARRSLHFARRHAAQGRPDLAALMLHDARIERARWHHWRRRNRLLTRD